MKKLPCGEEDRSECERDGITIHGGWGPISISKNEDGVKQYRLENASE